MCDEVKIAQIYVALTCYGISAVRIERRAGDTNQNYRHPLVRPFSVPIKSRSWYNDSWSSFTLHGKSQVLLIYRLVLSASGLTADAARFSGMHFKLDKRRTSLAHRTVLLYPLFSTNRITSALCGLLCLRRIVQQHRFYSIRSDKRAILVTEFVVNRSRLQTQSSGDGRGSRA